VAPLEEAGCVEIEKTRETGLGQNRTAWRRATAHGVAMKTEQKQALVVGCPTCGAKPREKCQLSTGQPRAEPHRDRRLAVSEKQKASSTFRHDLPS
jgi:hypothetical protein